MEDMHKPTFSDAVRQAEYDAHGGRCRVDGCTRSIHSFHHRCPNTKVNQKKYPFFLQSSFNCAGLCHMHHQSYTTVPNLAIRDRIAAVYEGWLQMFAKGIK